MQIKGTTRNYFILNNGQNFINLTTLSVGKKKNGNYITFGNIVYYNYFVEHYGILIKLRIYRPLQPTVTLFKNSIGNMYRNVNGCIAYSSQKKGWD